MLKFGRRIEEIAMDKRKHTTATKISVVLVNVYTSKACVKLKPHNASDFRSNLAKYSATPVQSPPPSSTALIDKY
jgi:hypothetical protein